ncbi:hypothetical protein R3P38DRAFT_3450274 [Favolaschia claudopus]|uniref:F-box domain-containing protein n=1 Tax=Favolaschia claudopus TaxID=2862362 RepID=A0AAV9ZMA2_9AGAR
MHQPIRYLTLLPIEIWTLCWSLCSLRQQRRLSLVCKPFRSITLPILFHHLSFDAGVDVAVFCMEKEDRIRRLRSMHRTAVRLEKLTQYYSQLQPALAPFVKSWTVVLGYQERYRIDNIGLSEALHTRIYESFGKVLTLCYNLSAVHLKRLKMDTMLLSTVLSLPKLQHLTLDTRESTIVDTGGVLPRKTMLRSLDLSQDYLLREGFAEIDLPILAHLTLHSVTEQESFFQHVAERFTRLETLTVDSIQGSDFPVIKTNSLPILRALTGPPTMITSLAPNRPITRVSIGNSTSTPASLLQTCAALSRSSVAVRTLHLPELHFIPQFLPWQSNSNSDGVNINPLHDFLTQIASLLPDLTELVLELPDPRPGFSCGYFGGGLNIDSELVGVDELPILCDDTAFDGLPEHEVSDDEGDASDPATNTDGSIILFDESLGEIKIDFWQHDVFLYQISPSSIPLPRSIEILHLHASWVGIPLALAAQERAVESLATAYPTLREVQLGLRRNSTWRRAGLSESLRRVVVKSS